ncbi:MAG: hypothetical protein WA156_19825, partial [Methylocystis silviterrae]
MILEKRLFAAGLLCSLVMISACGQGPSQISRLIVDPKAVYNEKIYSLPRGIISLSIKDVKGEITITPPEARLYPDVHARFAAEWLEDPSANDHFTFQIGSDGLLASTSAINKDETAAIIGRVAEIAAEIGKSTAGFVQETISEADPCQNFARSAQIDPFKIRSLRKAQNTFGECFDIDLKKLDGSAIIPISNEQTTEIAEQCNGGICARLAVPVLISIT